MPICHQHVGYWRWAQAVGSLFIQRGVQGFPVPPPPAGAYSEAMPEEVGLGTAKPVSGRKTSQRIVPISQGSSSQLWLVNCVSTFLQLPLKALLWLSRTRLLGKDMPGFCIGCLNSIPRVPRAAQLFYVAGLKVVQEAMGTRFSI